LTGFCDGKTLWQGRTDRHGIAIASESFGAPHGGSDCRWGRPPLMATARTADDFSFALSSWNEGIGPYDFGLNVGGEWNTHLFHTVLDRPLFRAGETVSMKHFLRRHVSEGMAVPDPLAGAYTVIISHLGSDQRYELTASFNANGTAL